jgi:hypothetical protein
MADGRTRKTGQHDQQLIRALAEATEAKRAVAALTERVDRLEAELALLRGAGATAMTSGKRVLPPPLPASQPTGPIRRQSKGYIDVSDMAELVESERGSTTSIPPPRRK